MSLAGFLGGASQPGLAPGFAIDIAIKAASQCGNRGPGDAHPACAFKDHSPEWRRPIPKTRRLKTRDGGRTDRQAACNAVMMRALTFDQAVDACREFIETKEFDSDRRARQIY